MDRVAAGLRMAKERALAVPGEAPARAGADAWQRLRHFDPQPAAMERTRVVTFGRTDPACASFDMIRTKLLFWMRQNGWTSVGITSPTTGCGKTTVSLNLAFSLAQSQTRVLLVDLDLRRPAVARHIGLSLAYSMADVLQGKVEPADHFVRCGENLAIGAGAAAGIGNSGDLLLSEAAARGVAALESHFMPEVIVYDLPPMLVADDVLAFMPYLDCVLLIVAVDVTRPDEVLACQGELTAHGASVGVVVNKCVYAEGGGDHEASVDARLRRGR